MDLDRQVYQVSNVLGYLYETLRKLNETHHMIHEYLETFRKPAPAVKELITIAKLLLDEISLSAASIKFTIDKLQDLR